MIYTKTLKLSSPLLFLQKTCKKVPMFFVKRRCKKEILLSVQKHEKTDAKAQKSHKQELKDFSKIYDKYFDKVYRFFYFRLRSPEDAEDLTAETFEKILKNLKKYEDRGLPLGAWIFRIARNMFVDFLRKKKAHIESIDDLAPSKEPSKEFDLTKLDNQMLTDELWEVIRTLPQTQQTLWSLKLSEDLSHKEIANIMDTSEANINVMLHRSTKTLKIRLSHLNNE